MEFNQIRFIHEYMYFLVIIQYGKLIFIPDTRQNGIKALVRRIASWTTIKKNVMNVKWLKQILQPKYTFPEN
jgi:hypothetical protein